jgi:hypothetical protein
MIIRGTQVLTIVPSRNENTLLLKTQNNYTHIKLLSPLHQSPQAIFRDPFRKGKNILVITVLACRLSLLVH